MKVEDINEGYSLKSMPYEEAIRVWNDYMINTGIRKYCQERCRGDCCKGVRPEKCKGKCDRKLPCVAFLCFKMEKKYFSKRLGDIYTKAKYKNFDIIKSLFYKLGMPYNPWNISYDKRSTMGKALCKEKFYVPRFLLSKSDR